jgi:hypothetical protein
MERKVPPNANVGGLKSLPWTTSVSPLDVYNDYDQDKVVSSSSQVTIESTQLKVMNTEILLTTDVWFFSTN